MSLPDLSYDIIAGDRFSQSFGQLERDVRNSDRQVDALTRSLQQTERQAERTATSGRGIGTAFGGLGSSLGKFAIGGLTGLAAGIGVRGAVQGATAWANYATQVDRTSEAFELLSGGSTNATAKLVAVQRASGGAISGLSAMQIANKAAALGFADTAKELERVTKFATISGRVLGLDTVAALENLSAAAANLSFVRLDQMGVAGDRARERFNELKETMGESQAFLQAALEVGEQTFSALEDSSIAAASGVEKLNAAWADFLADLTGPGSRIDAFAGDLALLLGGGDLEAKIQGLQNQLQSFEQLTGIGRVMVDAFDGGAAAIDDQAAAIAKLIPLLRGVEDATIANVDGAAEYRAELDTIAQAAINGVLSTDQINRLATIAEWWGIIGEGALFAAGAIAQAGAAMAQFPANIAGQIQFETSNREDPLDTFQRESQKARRDFVRDLREDMASDIKDRINDQLRATQAVNDAQFDLAIATTDTAGEIALYQAKLASLNEGSAEYIQTQATIARLQNRQAGEFERAGNSFISTLNRFESAFESAIGSIAGIPGFSGRTPVSEMDRRLSDVGLYRDKPDEFLRRAEDLLINNVARKDVDLKFIQQAVAASSGFGEGQLARIPGDLLFKLLEEEFTSGRIFGTDFGQANLGKLLNQDAIAAGLRQQGQANLGKQFLSETFKGGELPQIFAEAGGFAGQLEEQLNSSGFANQVGSIFNGQLTSDGVLSQIERAAPSINARLADAIVEGAGGTNVGARLLAIYLAQMMQANQEAN